ncbi:MAG: outer membrane protein assembly factor BamC [Burkholderiaceae bacterium]
MISCNVLRIAPPRAIRLGGVALSIAAVAGCSSIGSALQPKSIDYKSASSASAPSLEVPPDLTQLQRDNRYAIPEANRGVATASAYSERRANAPAAAPSDSAVLPKTGPDIKLEKAGNERWLVVKESPEELWPQIKEFWQDNGFLIDVDSPQTGVMETDWAENRAKIPQDFIRRTLGKAIDSLYSTGERDKFRTRLERGPDGTTEIYISHRGAQEVVTGVHHDSTVWTPRPTDPGLEAEFLQRLRLRLAGDEKTKTQTATAAEKVVAQPEHSHLVKAAGDQPAHLDLDDAFDRAWRRVGLALDRVGFTVEDRDRSRGLYFVRYVDQNQDAQDKSSDKKGFFSRFFSRDKKQEKSARRYQVLVKPDASGSRVSVLDADGHPETSATGGRILVLLNDQLK